MFDKFKSKLNLGTKPHFAGPTKALSAQKMGGLGMSSFWINSTYYKYSNLNVGSTEQEVINIFKQRNIHQK